MGLSVLYTRFFVSGERVPRSLPWMWASIRLASEARFLLSQVVDRVGRIEVPPPLASAFMYMYRLTGGSISGLLGKRATANPFTRASCYSWSSNGHTSSTVWQNIRSVPLFLQPPAIDKEPESNAKMYVNQRRDEMARTWKHILRHDHFRAKYRYEGVFFERRFQPLSVGGFFSNQRESISRCPKSPFPSKTQNRQIARTSPLRPLCEPCEVRADYQEALQPLSLQTKRRQNLRTHANDLHVQLHQLGDIKNVHWAVSQERAVIALIADWPAVIAHLAEENAEPGEGGSTAAELLKVMSTARFLDFSLLWFETWRRACENEVDLCKKRVSFGFAHSSCQTTHSTWCAVWT